jgi:hypothetical protein
MISINRKYLLVEFQIKALLIKVNVPANLNSFLFLDHSLYLKVVFPFPSSKLSPPTLLSSFKIP